MIERKKLRWWIGATIVVAVVGAAGIIAGQLAVKKGGADDVRLKDAGAKAGDVQGIKSSPAGTDSGRPPPTVTCQGADLDKDPMNCGQCGAACGAGEPCVSGKCVKTSCVTGSGRIPLSAGAETQFVCNMKPGATVVVAADGSHEMSDFYVFPQCSQGMCDVTPYNIAVSLTSAGLTKTAKCTGRQSQPCSLHTEGTVKVPDDGLLTITLRVDACQWWHHDRCNLSFVRLSAKQQ